MRPRFEPPVVFITAAADDRSADIVEAALRGGLRAVQLRDRFADGGLFTRIARRIRLATSAAKALLIVNDRIDVALAVGADGVHLPASGFDAQTARDLIGDGLLLGRSVHSIEEIERLAGRSGEVDYVQFGPVFDTPSKRAFGPPQGTETLAAAAEAAHELGIGLVAVGGIDEGRYAETFQAGADAVALIRAISDAKDPEHAARIQVQSARAASRAKAESTLGSSG